MPEIREYILVDEEGADVGGPTRDLEALRQHARTLSGRHALVAQVYEMTGEELVELPPGATEWPPTEAAQDESGRRFVDVGPR